MAERLSADQSIIVSLVFFYFKFNLNSNNINFETVLCSKKHKIIELCTTHFSQCAQEQNHQRSLD